MRKLRRSLPALLLSLALTLCFCTTALAAGFADSESIGEPFRKAVEQMTARGVLNGFPDGSFHPEETLTREQGAKIVTYMILGGEANTLTCDRAPFSDVPANLWSAPCIAWCAEREILLGYGGGIYGPVDTLTGDQFAKMLLCALKLARDGNYVGLGSDWFTAVREDGRAAGLYQGDGAMESDHPITRQQAALMAWNAVLAAEKDKSSAEPASAAPQPASPSRSGTSASSPQSSTGSEGGTETPEIDIPSVPPTDPVRQDPVRTDDSGDILTPEVSR